LVCKVDFPCFQTRQQLVIHFRLFLVQYNTLFFPIFELELDLLLINDFVHIVIIFIPNEVQFIVHQDGPIKILPSQDGKQFLVHT